MDDPGSFLFFLFFWLCSLKDIKLLFNRLLFAHKYQRLPPNLNIFFFYHPVHKLVGL